MSNTNNWNLSQADPEYVDFEKELIDFDDEGNSSVDMRLTFVVKERAAYIVLQRKNNDGDTRDPGGQINISWDEGIRHLGDNPELLKHLATVS